MDRTHWSALGGVDPARLVEAWPRPADLQPASLPALAPLGHWHTEGFFAAVATAKEILSRPDPDAGVPPVHS